MDDADAQGALEPQPVATHPAVGGDLPEPVPDLEVAHARVVDQPAGQDERVRRSRVGVPHHQRGRGEHEPELETVAGQVVTGPVELVEVDPRRDHVHLVEQRHQRVGGRLDRRDAVLDRGAEHPHPGTTPEVDQVGRERVSERVALRQPAHPRPADVAVLRDGLAHVAGVQRHGLGKIHAWIVGRRPPGRQLARVGDQLPWNPAGTRAGRCTAATSSSVSASRNTQVARARRPGRRRSPSALPRPPPSSSRARRSRTRSPRGLRPRLRTWSTRRPGRGGARRRRAVRPRCRRSSRTGVAAR